MYDFDEIIPRRSSHCAKWDEVGADLLPMWVADMDFKSPPGIIAALEARVRHGIFGYSGGYDSWYSALIDWMKNRYNWEPWREWITTSPGVVPALDMLVRALTDPDDQVIIQPPVYHPFFSVVHSNGRQLLENPLYYDGFKYRMDLKSLKHKLNSRVKLLLLCSPHNPVGRVWTHEELQAIGEICLEHDIVVVSDEIHSDLVMPGYQHTVFASIAPAFEQNCVICNSPSKTFNMAGIQASNIIIPNEKIRTAYKRILKTGELDLPNVFAVTAVEAAYTQGANWLQELIIYIHGNYIYLCNFIKEKLPRIRITEPEGTYLVWLDFRALGMDNQQLDTFIREQAGLRLSPGHIFGGAGSGFQRLNIACPRSVLKQALLKLENAFGTL
ncbi:MAG: MalY/PatB family protein [Syntrophomonas sp.]